MSKLLSEKERDLAAYFDAHVDVLLNPYATFSPIEQAAYRAYERYWRYEAKRFGKMLLNKRVLSLGTGTAADDALFRDQGIEYVGIDISEKVLQGAITRIPRPTVARMNMRNLGLADNSFGGVWAFDSISHIREEHIEEVLSEAHRVIQPGGFLYVSTLLGKGAVDEGAIGYAQHWMPDEFAQKLRDTGFNVINLLSDNHMGGSAFIAQPQKG